MRRMDMQACAHCSFVFGRRLTRASSMQTWVLAVVDDALALGPIFSRMFPRFRRGERLNMPFSFSGLIDYAFRCLWVWRLARNETMCCRAALPSNHLLNLID